MLVVFPPIFVADTKIIYGYHFVATLKMHGVKFFQHANIVCICAEAGGNNFETYLNDSRTAMTIDLRAFCISDMGFR